MGIQDVDLIWGTVVGSICVVIVCVQELVAVHHVKRRKRMNQVRAYLICPFSFGMEYKTKNPWNGVFQGHKGEDKYFSYLSLFCCRKYSADYFGIANEECLTKCSSPSANYSMNHKSKIIQNK